MLLGKLSRLLTVSSLYLMPFRGWYNHVKGYMEQGIIQYNYRSLSIFQPAAIYPGNDNTPSALGEINKRLNWLLPGALNTVSSEEIGRAMMITMNHQLDGKNTGVEYIRGGKNIRSRSLLGN